MSYGPIMLDLTGKTITAIERELIRHPNVGGVILFSRNYESPSQLKNLIAEIRHLRNAILIAVDQEGGRVQRFREGFTRLPPLAKFGQLYRQDPETAKRQAENSAEIMASELLTLGIDFSFAPVLDVDHGVSEVIGDRSFNHDAEIVYELALAYIQGLKQKGMSAIGKHFPGHGAVAADSHKELPIDRRDFSAIWENDLLPFRKLNQQLAGIMTAHVVFSKLDKKPASFSPYWLQEILRQQLQFTGAIFSDDLGMGGAEYAGNFLNRTQLALAAGCDMVLICNNQTEAIAVVDSLRYNMPNSSQQRLAAMRHPAN